jgi:glycerophosphoryl diester phosphodiesterase
MGRMRTPDRVLPALRPAGHRPPDAVVRIAHRGGNGAENYDPASLHRLAVAGAHLLEFDVQTTTDNQLVIAHDPLVGTGAATIRIADATLSQLRNIGNARMIPELRSVVRSARAAGLGLYVDIKTLTEIAVTRLTTILRAERMADRVILASHDPELVQLCAAITPDLPRAVLIRSTTGDPVQIARHAQADFVHPCWEHDPRPDHTLAQWLDPLRQSGIGVICWHEERPDILTALYGLGVDGICSDQPQLLLQASTHRPPTDAHTPP